MFTLEFPRPTFTEKSPPQVTPQVTPQVARLLEIIDGEMTRGQIMKEFGLKDRKHFGKTYLSPAMAAECIEMTIPDKPNSRMQRYRLTAKGKRYSSK